MGRLKLRLLPFALAVALGAACDAYVRRPDDPGRTQCFRTSWKCYVVSIADHPVDFLRASWVMLTEG
ncbi:MAG TPA: hypothetical protein VF064_14565 [Pyrinomonadaceae bacterium]